jgi:hypothetical protein
LSGSEFFNVPLAGVCGKWWNGAQLHMAFWMDSGACPVFLLKLASFSILHTVARRCEKPSASASAARRGAEQSIGVLAEEAA